MIRSKEPTSLVVAAVAALLFFIRFIFYDGGIKTSSLLRPAEKIQEQVRRQPGSFPLEPARFQKGGVRGSPRPPVPAKKGGIIDGSVKKESRKIHAGALCRPPHCRAWWVIREHRLWGWDGRA